MYTLDKIKKNIIEVLGVKLKTSDLPSLKLRQTSLVYPPNSQMGDISLPVFDLAKEFKKKPNELVKELKKKLDKDDIKKAYISDLKADGPYLNFFINKEKLTEDVLKKVRKQKDKYGKNNELKGKKIMVEFAHPNPFKSFHIGHLRNIFLGESIVRLLEATGAKVIRTNYQGDVGLHIAKCLWAFQNVAKNKYPKTADKKVAMLGECYRKGAAAYEKDEKAQAEIAAINKKIYSQEDKKINQLWELGKKWSLEKFQEIYTRVDTTFNKEYMESEVMDEGIKQVNKALKKGILKKSQGAIVFDGKKYKLDTRVFMNSEGLPTYEGKELGLAYKEFKDFGKIDLNIHVVAVEQISFFKVTFKVEELLDKKMFAGKQYHHAYEFVGLKKGKMSSRKGEVVLGNDILNEAKERIIELMKDREEIMSRHSLDMTKEVAEIVGMGAVKYAFLKISPFKYLAFDMDECVSFSGDSGPYLQYTFARIRSVLRKANSHKLKHKWPQIIFQKLDNKKEHGLVLKMAKYPEVVKKASGEYDPSEIAKYLFELAQEFNDYYHQVPVLKAPKKVREARLALIMAVSQVIQNGLDLLGIGVVEEM